MVQRVLRQIHESRLDAEVTIATSVTQLDAIISQLCDSVDTVSEPTRRDTFPAICLASEYLAKEKGCSPDEVVVVMPCDPYTDAGYFDIISKMGQCVERDVADLVLMGIIPTYPSSKYGDVVTDKELDGIAKSVKHFTEKPNVEVAKKLINEGALWNGGVFAFRLGYITKIAEKYVNYPTFTEIRDHYSDFPKISFDYEVAEKAQSVALVPFSGQWKDLGTWNTLTDELPDATYGNVTVDNTVENTHVVNELDIPVMCIGAKNLIVAASPDGILVSEKSRSEDIKSYADKLKHRPMFEERRWGIYKVVDFVEYPDGYSTMTKHLTLNPGCSISYQEHSCRDEVWTFINGKGQIVLDGKIMNISRGDTVLIPKGMKHALRAITSLSLIEIQSGMNLVETDIKRYSLSW